MKGLIKSLTLSVAASIVTSASTINHVSAYEAGDWVIRADAATVAPNDSGSQLQLNNSDTALSARWEMSNSV